MDNESMWSVEYHALPGSPPGPRAGRPAVRLTMTPAAATAHRGNVMTKPVHASIRDDLRMRIAGGEWAAGDRLPSETDLAARYGVARMTVRQAIGALAGEGVVVRRQGLGTFAADRPPGQAGGRVAELHRGDAQPGPERAVQGDQGRGGAATGPGPGGAAAHGLRRGGHPPAGPRRGRLPHRGAALLAALRTVRRARRRTPDQGLAVRDDRGPLRGPHHAGQAGVHRHRGRASQKPSCWSSRRAARCCGSPGPPTTGPTARSSSR